MISFLVSLLMLLPLQSIPFTVAHRGGHIDGLVPENSTTAVMYAKKYGYKAIECDVHYTKDNVMILMHDATINRTMRRASDYSEIKEPIKYSDLSFEELRKNYVLASSNPGYRKPIPTFEEILVECRKYHITPMLHTDLSEAYQLAHKMLGNNFIAFNSNYDAVKKAREISSCLILWDPGTNTAEDVITKLKVIGGKCGISSMKTNLLTKDYVKTIRKAGYEVQSSIFPMPFEEISIANGVSIVLSNFTLLENRQGKPVKKFRAKSQELNKGDHLAFSYDTIEFGSLELEFDVKGEVEMIVNGKHHYKFSSPTEFAHHKDGWRFYNEQPSIELISNSDSVISSLKIKVYKH